MLVFSTRLPIKDNISAEDCLNLCIKWITQSPHYSINVINYDVHSHSDFDLIDKKISIYIRHYQNENTELYALRLQNVDRDITWLNDCIFVRENDEQSMLIQLNRNCSFYTSPPSHIRKPYVVRMFVESGFCKDDAGIPIVDTALEADDCYFDTCVDIMNGSHTSSMPTVYVSCDYWGNFALDAKYLAEQLGGMAHVFVQKSHDTAIKLRDLTNSNNAHTGYIGVYYPGKKYCYKYSEQGYPSDKEMAWEIINDIRISLTNRLDASTNNWNQIITAISRQRISELKDLGEQSKKELDMYMSDFDKEQESLKEKIAELNQQLQSAQSRADTYHAALMERSEQGCFYNKGRESDLYLSEHSDLLFNILSQAKDKYDVDSRGYAIIESLLEANPRRGECEKIIKGVHNIFDNGGKLTSAQKAQLKTLGFTIEEDRKHHILTFHDPRYIFTAAKTPSEYREGKNLASDICKILDIEKKVF